MATITRFIKIDTIDEMNKFVAAANAVPTDVIGYKGKFAVDCKSLLGIMSINPTEGFVVEYEDAETVFADFIEQFKREQ